MATKTEDKVAAPVAKSALIFELDDVALEARAIRYDILQGILKEQKIDFPAPCFSRYCLEAFPSTYLPSLLQTLAYTAASAEQVNKRLLSETTSRLMQKDTTIRANLIPWLDAAAARQFSIVGLSILPDADAIAEHLDFARWGTRILVPAPSDKPFPHPDLWLRAAKAAGRNPKNTLAIVSSEDSAKGALAAGMNVIAIPDSFTDFQDFSGVNCLCESLSDLTPAALFDELSL